MPGGGAGVGEGGGCLVGESDGEEGGRALPAAPRGPPPSEELHPRRKPFGKLLPPARPATAEESVFNGPVKQVLLTSHRPVRIAERNLLLSSAADISEQKPVEDHLFRSAYYHQFPPLPPHPRLQLHPTPLAPTHRPPR